MTEGYIASREDVVAKLYELWMARQAMNEAKKVDSKITKAIKEWMEEEGETDLFDGEHGIHAYGKPSKSTNWDLRYAPAEVLVQLAREGLLDVKMTAFREARTNRPNVLLDDAMNFCNEGENYQLRVEKKD